MLIAAATLAARRWGPTVGGLLVGLPLTSGPVSVFLALEQGRTFAATAARGSMLGLIGVAAFCVAYARVAARLGPPGCLAIGFVAYAAVMLLAQRIEAGAWGAFVVTIAALVCALPLMPHPPGTGVEQQPPPWWDLPLRIVAATGMVLLITAVASALGPTWSGLLSPFPVFSSVLAAFAHAMSGPDAAARLQRGVVMGVFSFAAFFLVVTLLVEAQSLALAYLCATGTALVVNGLSVVAVQRKNG